MGADDSLNGVSVLVVGAGLAGLTLRTLRLASHAADAHASKESLPSQDKRPDGASVTLRRGADAPDAVLRWYSSIDRLLTQGVGARG